MKTILTAILRWSTFVILASFCYRAGFGAVIVTGDDLNIGIGHTLTGTHASIAGGSNNTASANYVTVGGGTFNTASGLKAFLGGGSDNSATASGSVVTGGEDNLASGIRSVIAGGYANTNKANSGVIGGGYLNLINSSGLYDTIAGGYGHLMDAATSGRTICGGSFNTNNAYSGFIGGGELNGITGGDSALVGGFNNVVDSTYAFLGAGLGNWITSIGDISVLGGGVYNTINADHATIGGGSYNEVTAASGTIPGGDSAKASRYGEHAYASGCFVDAGDAQQSVFVLRQTTTNATQTELFLDGSSQRMTVPTGGTWTFNILIAARGSTNSAGFKFDGVIDNDSGSTTIVGTNVVGFADANATGWNATVSGGNAALKVLVTGAANSTIRWVASVTSAQVKN